MVFVEIVPLARVGVVDDVVVVVFAELDVVDAVNAAGTVVASNASFVGDVVLAVEDFLPILVGDDQSKVFVLEYQP